MKLYSHWRSSCAYRARIALNMKGVPYEVVPLDLGVAREQRSDAYRAINPNARVPTLVLDDGTPIAQSLAIIEWLEETAPEPALLPADPRDRARCRAMALTVIADIQPVQAIGVLNAIRERFGADDEATGAWARHWIARGLEALETEAARLGAGDGDRPFLFGDAPGLAEIALVPQLGNARAMGLDLAAYPRLAAIDAAARAVPAFAAAAPERQPDAPAA